MGVTDRSPGWDSKVRREVRLKYGSIRSYADHIGVDHSDIESGQGDDMKVWSRIVAAVGGTENIDA